MMDTDKELTSTEREPTGLEDYIIHPRYAQQCITYIFFGTRIVDEYELVWQTIPKDDWRYQSEDENRYMTLGQLSKQLYASGKKGIITVVVEEPLRGAIYQIGNYQEMKWGLHGTTRGYA